MKLEEHKLYGWIILLLVLMGSLALWTDVMEPDAALYASIGKNIVLRNDWLNLDVRGADWLDKPHLTFWIVAASFKLFGISAFAYKLPSFLASLLGAYYLYRFAKSLYNQQTALLSVIIFLSALHVVISNFDVRAESYITFFVLASLYHYYRAHRSSWLHLVAGSLFAACAMMVKGIFVTIPILGGCIIYWLLTNQYRQFLKVKWWLALLLILFFISPELYALYQQFDLHPEKVVFGQTGYSGLRFFFWDSQFGRFFNNGPIKGRGDLSFFLHTTLWAFLPWSILLCGAVVSLFKKKGRAGLPPENIMVWSSAAVTFLIFSLSKFQLPHYIIIIFPQFAMMTAVYLNKLAGKGLLTFYRVQGILLVLVMALLIGLAVLFRFEATLGLLLILVLVCLGNFLLFGKASKLTIVASGSATAIGLMVFLYLFFYPAILKYQAGMQAGRWLNEHYPQTDAGVLMYVDAFSFDFYANKEASYFYSFEELDKRHKKEMILYVPAAQLPRLQTDYGAKVLKAFDYYHITKLKGSFLNYRTRAKVLEKFYLVKLP
ncbi:glycosyltransferase family 39 protein [Pedobacter sp. KR3-3]|uniref:Glycosyltransferase family 39 protein n=1 Tax=Pedobacter albus TaxID=3113905 RepID=A0ABU7ICD2_9SPHI|nr:glycosyltransferase family 39 protein [Pedobacter sp. KR3-3]MEE1947150.1 glycosyltransferase family 39 protein [Pedobacter sp. KR3-3]